MKNEMEIKDDIYHLLKYSDLANNVSGKLSKTLRPEGSAKEDIVISVLSENPDIQIQEVYINVNVYVADVKRDNQYEENAIRIKELMTISKKVFDLAVGKEYRITLADQRIYEVPGKNEHFINNKILYQHCNEI